MDGLESLEKQASRSWIISCHWYFLIKILDSSFQNFLFFFLLDVEILNVIIFEELASEEIV